ncbi:MAG: C69 family dipeptidase [Gemmatimonadota bacterium]|nr:C69 family dipeptidase [Gemmatimonadota bacterium]
MMLSLSGRSLGIAGTTVFLVLGALVASGRSTAPDPASVALSPPAKSIALYVGRNLTEDGSVLLGGFGHEPSSHWYEITPARTFPSGTTIEVGITEEARIPGRRFRIPQATETLRFITTNYSEFAGFPPPLTNGGLNERHVAARDVWSPSRQELVEATPTPQRGLNYSDLSRIAMERAGTAREAVEIVGELIEEHGYATYGGNSHLFADAEEGWVLIDYAGGQGLWAAERLGPDEVRVSYPGYIGDFPVDFEDSPDFMGSENLVSFAVEQGWWNPDGDEPFNLHRVYGRPFPSAPSQDDPHNLFRYPPLLEDEIREMAPLSLEDMLALVRDPRWSNDGSGYGQVAHLRPDVPSELGTLWMSITGAVASPFVPVRLGAREVPPEYKQHRYMTKDADDAFLDSDFAPIEATRSAFRTHKRLLYHTCERPEVFLRAVTADLEAFESRLVAEQAEVEREAEARYSAGDSTGAREFLTDYGEERLLDALSLGERLVERVERETRERFGVRMPTAGVPEGATWRPESGPMTLREGRTYHRCFREGFDAYPRPHGSYAAEASDPLIDGVLDGGVRTGG